jgi:SAM-dependent methyltransferase
MNNNSTPSPLVCLACGNNDLEIKDAMISPFLVERVWNNSIDNKTNIFHCKKCGFAFFKIRLNEKEMEKLYKNYRDDFYQEQRQKYDSWYTKDINNLADSEIIVKNRQELINGFLSKHIDASAIRSVMDYGGNTGIHIPNIFINAKKYVFDISGVKKVEGVYGINNISDVKKQKYDFVMCLGVLEHVSEPNQVLKQLKELVAENGYLYIDVPFDSPFYKHKPSKLLFLFNKHFSLKVILDRFLRDRKNPFIMHEHQNYFTENSSKEMLKRCGLNVLVINTVIEKGALGYGQTINILANISDVSIIDK